MINNDEVKKDFFTIPMFVNKENMRLIKFGKSARGGVGCSIVGK